MADHDQVHTQLLGEAADLLDGLTDGKVPGGLETLLGERPDAFVEHDLGALFLFFQQLLRHEALGQEEAGRHARNREQVDFGVMEYGELGAFEQRPLAFLGTVVSKENLLILHVPSCRSKAAELPGQKFDPRNSSAFSGRGVSPCVFLQRAAIILRAAACFAGLFYRVGCLTAHTGPSSIRR